MDTKGISDAENNAQLPNDQTKCEIQIEENVNLGLHYSIHDSPPWYMCLLFGIQDVMTALGAMISIPFLLLPAMCSSDSVEIAKVINTTLFVSGINTIMQSLIGVRLPVIQGPAFGYLTVVLAILSLEKWQCPETEQHQDIAVNSSSSDQQTMNITIPTEHEHDDNELNIRMREIQGAIILSALFQLLIGTTGLMGVMLRFIGPLVIAPIITLIGLGLFGSAANLCAENWYIALMTIALIIILSQYLRQLDLPCCSYNKTKGFRFNRYPIFKLFPMILSISIAWITCVFLTLTNAIPNDPKHWAYSGRTDTKSEVLKEAAWIRVPYPGQWGVPTFSIDAALGVLPAAIAGTAESIGVFYACASLSGAPHPPVHAINRGVLTHGLGNLFMGAWGAGVGTASYSENLGAMSITKVGNTRVAIAAGLVMMFCGVIGKLGALFVTIPNPVIGGVLMVMFGIITAAGVSNLQNVNMNSSRSLLIFGFSTFFGLSLPHWVNSNLSSIDIGNDTLNQIIRVLLSTSMFVGGFIAFVFDNTIPGTNEERGISRERTADEIKEDDDQLSCYDLPVGMKIISKFKITELFPICPTFTGFRKRNGNTRKKNVVT